MNASFHGDNSGPSTRHVTYVLQIQKADLCFVIQSGTDPPMEQVGVQPPVACTVHDARRVPKNIVPIAVPFWLMEWNVSKLQRCHSLSHVHGHGDMDPLSRRS